MDGADDGDSYEVCCQPPKREGEMVRVCMYRAGLESEEGHRPLPLVWLPPVLAAGVGLEKIDQEEGSLTWGQG